MSLPLLPPAPPPVEPTAIEIVQSVPPVGISASPTPPELEASLLTPLTAQTSPLPTTGASWRQGDVPAILPASVPGIPLYLEADAQSFDPQEQIITASGSVRVQFADAQLSANQLWVNLLNRYVRADGDVVYVRGDQEILGESATYNLTQGSGSVIAAEGVLLLTDFDDAFSLPTSAEVAATRQRPIEDRYRDGISVSEVTSPGGLILSTDNSRPIEGGEGGRIQRLRVAAERLDFDDSGWVADGIRLTNDPFSPPEIEFRGSRATLTPISPEEDELFIENGRVVFDQGFSLPLPRSRFILQRGALDADELNPLPLALGIDGRDRGGLFIEREYIFASPGGLRFSLVPQFYIERWLGESGANIGEPANFGLVGRLGGRLGPQTSLRAVASLSGLDLSNFEERFRASIRAQHQLGTHLLNLEYSYRERLFNGSLGFQDVQSSLGAVLLSPQYVLGDSQVTLTYQLAAQYVTALTDRADLLNFGATQDLTSLFRFQGSVALGRRFRLWQGEPLPATPTEGLRYSPRPVVPFLDIVTGLRGVVTYYTSSDLQETLTTSVGLEGQLGRSSRDFFDYTRFNLLYSRSFVGGADSPFLFDRNIDRNVLSFGVIQQVYGPFRLGIQTAINLDTGREIDTDVIFEYSRRAYGLVFRYNPVQTSGFLGLRLSDFDWSGRPESLIRPVEDGVIR